jgi:hypothetical protein
MSGRRQYSRPQALLFANNPGIVTPEGFYIPSGNEVGALVPPGTEISETNNFIILSDDNRSPIDFEINRIENKQRMVNGRMRSYHIADKARINVSWDMLPSRSFRTFPEFDPSTGKSPRDKQFGSPNQIDSQFTSDAGAGGVDILNWYENNNGSFWVYLAYDKRTNFGNTPDSYLKLPQYNEIIEVFFDSFDYSVVKRGGTNHDFWNVSLTLEEV